MDLVTLVRRFIYPRTDTLDAAWHAAANAGYASAIMAMNHALFGAFILFTPGAPVGPGTAQLGFGFVYGVIALYGFRRSRSAATIILVLVVFEALLEAMFVQEYRLNLVTLGAALILAVGGFRGAYALAGYRRA